MPKTTYLPWQKAVHVVYHGFWQAMDWIYPPSCGGCGAPGERWCSECQAKCNRVGNNICPICGEPQPKPLPCIRCKRIEPAYTAARAWGFYHGPLKKAIHRLKYKGDIGLAEPLAYLLTDKLCELNWDVDCVTPIPLSRARAKERGYNQSALLAKPLAYALKIQFTSSTVRRSRNTRSQVGLSERERADNLTGAFVGDSADAAGKRILLVDDVMTTGATLNACAQALREAGAREVYGLTLAKTAAMSNGASEQPITADQTDDVEELEKADEIWQLPV